ncbi:DNA ligase D [Paraburkholderia rhizosphaerae]|uniref:DNA ligase (ATP) n=1 Tax=Paraburkholderia rhizosphaerae TaxID=480658 RepID=A0A4V3HFF9_9BURK|nr:DNA ligase D [Paraburkholderia rhizosphaerae]TDY52898.1 bifunctional non-homologous end joining protein LigD [Paraburkholderia rhizosphaerae]
MADKLETYHRKRRFDKTPEPSGATAQRRSTSGTAARKSAHALAYVIQEHDARRLHYDFRLELDGTLKSWAVPKGPSLDPSVKRLAVHVEDHPLEYGSFEGTIPQGHYGAGEVIVWDRGTWEPAGGEDDARAAYAAGKLKFHLHGDKLHGGWTLVRSHMRGSGDKEQWLLIKERDSDAHSESEFDVLDAFPGSVLSDARGARGTGENTRTGSRGGEAGKGDARGGAKRVAADSHHTRAVIAKPKTTGRTKRAAVSSHPDIVATRNSESLRELAGNPSIEGAVKIALPTTFKPQLATLVDSPPAGDTWRYEIKFDGYRVLARIDHRNAKDPVRIYTRAGNDWTDKFSKQAQALAAVGVDTAWLDGEAVVLNNDGIPNFQALQNAFDSHRERDITLFLFDVPYLNGYDLRGVPLEQRRALLRALLEPLGDDSLRYSADFGTDAQALLKSACEMSLEGIIGKRCDSRYTSGRTSAWIKLKCRRRQEFVIGGYTEPGGSRTDFGALLLGVHDAHGKLRYAGRVGTGFDAARLRSLKKELDALETSRMPFASAPSERSRTPVHWVKPELVAECNFAEWTDEGIVRQASFVSLRRDKPARQIVIEAARKGVDVQQSTDEERAVSASPSRKNTRATKSQDAEQQKVATPRASKAKRSTTETVAGVRISHPDRVIDKHTDARKIDLVRYYESVADWMLPHLRDRPVALVRAPEDIGGELFFQKHAQKLSIPHVTQHEGVDPGHPPLITIETVQALVGAAQMGTIELHTWNAVASNIEKPDRVVFDLDPDASLGWERMIEAAQLTRMLLDELGLVSFCKTSGGKGLHLVVPLAKHAGWDEVKDFSQAVAQHMAATLPKQFAAKMGAQNRKGKIFVDYLRNNRGSSTVAAYSVRARPGLGVSVPIGWDEVSETTAGDQWNVANLHERLQTLRDDPWAAYAKTRQRITAAMKKRLAG